MAKDSKRWTPEAHARQQQLAKAQGLSAQGVTARKAKRRRFDANPLAEALASLLSPSTT